MPTCLPLLIARIPNLLGILLIKSFEGLSDDFMANFIALGKKVNVKINAKIIPTVIIFPNSITGFMSPRINERKAIAVVNVANKHGISI